MPHNIPNNRSCGSDMNALLIPEQSVAERNSPFGHLFPCSRLTFMRSGSYSIRMISWTIQVVVTVSFVVSAYLPEPVHARPYDFPFASPFAATVVGTPKLLRAELPRKIPIEDFELTVFRDREVPDVLWYNKTLRYSLVAQDHPAPLIVVIAGTGASYNAANMQALQRVFYQAGLHVLSLSSPTHPNFIGAASTTGVPGHLLDDSRDLYRVMTLAWLQIKEEIEVTAFYLTGYSLGAAEAAYVSKLDDERGIFQFQKVLLINPPVSLYTSALAFDTMLADNIPGGLNNFQQFFDRVFHAFSAVYREGAFVNFGDDFLYAAYQDRQPSDSELAALIGLSFRLSAASMFFTSDVVTNAGLIKPKNLVLSNTDSLTDYYKVSSRVSFREYFDELFSPFFQTRYPSLTESGLVHSLSLRELDAYLRQTPKIGLVHNADDIILSPGELDYLRDVFGSRATIYPRGGHCGNLTHRDNMAYLVEYFSHREESSQDMPSHTTQTRDTLGTSALLSMNPYEQQAPPPMSEDAPVIPAKRPVSEIVRADIHYPIDVYDPLEGFNRGVYKFNAKFDEYVFLPVVAGYRAVMPDFFEDRISNFFSNVADIRNFLNALFQLKGEVALNTLGRFLVNSTFGLGGFFDHATPLGIPQQTEDFGQTLGHYGLGPGPYLVLPIFGPSGIRDTTGFVVDSAARFFYLFTPMGLDTNTAGSSAYTLTNSTDTRHQVSFRYYETGSPFEYDLVRLLYTKKRELDIAK